MQLRYWYARPSHPTRLKWNIHKDTNANVDSIHSDKYDPLDYPQTLEETKERLRVQAEHTAQYASALAEGF